MKRTPLTRKTPLTAKASLQRKAPLRGNAGLTTGGDLRRTPMKRRPSRKEPCPPEFYAAMMERARGHCERCDRELIEGDLLQKPELSHRLDRSADPGGLVRWVAWNIDVLCARCHRWRTENPQDAATPDEQGRTWRVPGEIVDGRYRGPDSDFGRMVERLAA